MTHAPRFASPCLAVFPPASDTCSTLCFTLPNPVPPRVRHMLHASLHSAWRLSAPCPPRAPCLVSPHCQCSIFVSHISNASLRFLRLCNAVFLTHAPCLSSLCLAVIRPVADTRSVLRFTLLDCARSASHPPCPVPLFTLLAWHPLCFSHIRCASLHSVCLLCYAPDTGAVLRITLLRSTAPCFLHTHHASLLPAWLYRPLDLTHASCLGTPCLAVLLPAIQTNTTLHFTVPRSPSLCVRHMCHPSFLTASPVLSSSSDTCPVPRFTHTVNAELCGDHMPLASHHSAWLFCALHPTHAPRFTSSMRCASLVFVIYVCRPHRDGTGDVASRGGRM